MSTMHTYTCNVKCTNALSTKYLNRRINEETEEMNATAEARNKNDSDGLRYGTFVKHAMAIKC